MLSIKKKKSPISFVFLNPNCALGLLDALESFFPFYIPLSCLILFFAKPPGLLGGDSHPLHTSACRQTFPPRPRHRATVFSLIFSSHPWPQKPSSSSQGCRHPRQLPQRPVGPDPWSKEAELPELYPRSCHHKEPFLLRF